jgi:glycosyl transferase family 25
MEICLIILILIVLYIFLIILLPKKIKKSENGINKIMYINLDHRTDRKNQIEEQINSFNLINYERFPAISHSNGAIGCSKSHLAVIKKAKENNYKNILVLEDDFEFIVNKDEFYNQINNLLQVPFDVCLLAYNTSNLYDSQYPFLYKIKDAQTTSAYIIQSHYYDTLIAHWEYAIKMFEETNDDTKYTCDQSWKYLQEKDNWYCFKMRIGKQRKSYSDIQKGITDYNI